MLAWLGGSFLLVCFFKEVCGDGGPVGEFWASNSYPFTFELFGTVVGAVIDEVVTSVEFFVVGKDEPFVGWGSVDTAEVFLYPLDFVHPGEGVIPWGGGENVYVVYF